MNATLENPANLNLVLDVPVSLTIELGSCQLPMKEVLQLNVGSVVQLDKPADAPVERGTEARASRAPSAGSQSSRGPPPCEGAR